MEEDTSAVKNLQSIRDGLVRARRKTAGRIADADVNESSYDQKMNLLLEHQERIDAVDRMIADEKKLIPFKVRNV